MQKFVSSLICFIICVKSCSETVRNLLVFRVPLCGMIQLQKIAPKTMTITKTTASTLLSKYIEIIFQIRDSYLPYLYHMYTIFLNEKELF